MLEAHVGPFLQSIKGGWFGQGTYWRCRQVAVEFSVFMAGRLKAGERILPDHVSGYLDARSRIAPHLWLKEMSSSWRGQLAYAMSLFMKFLSQRGVTVPLAASAPKKDLVAVPGFDSTLRSYESFLRDQRGLARRTVSKYVEDAAELCRYLVSAKLRSFDDLTPKALYDHLLGIVRRRKNLELRCKQTALGNFFRYLRITGKCRKDFSVWLVRYRTYRMPGVPKTVEEDDLYKLFDSLKANTWQDIRDRAIFLLLTLLGLRVSEIAHLCLEDIRWRERKIVFRHRKGGRDWTLPLHPAVARALSEHIEKVRPHGVPHREVFLTRALAKPYRKGVQISYLLRHRLKKLGLRIHPHMLRHTLASRLINHGCPPEWIQQILGHTSFESTQIYAKVNLAKLSEVADNDMDEL